MPIVETTRLNQARRLLLGCCFGLAVACGGKVIEPGTSSANGGTNSGAAAATASSGGGGLDLSSQSVGTCKLGTLPAAGTPCPWMTGERCYQSVSAACACACPHDRTSLCTSGFPSGSDGRVAVTCQ